MCLAVVALDVHPRYSVVLVANRDEYHARPTKVAAWWTDPPILAGRDLKAGGTWLGVTRTGRWAFVTNVREGGQQDPKAPSRGALVPRVLDDHRDVSDAVAAAVNDASRHNGFNLMAGEGALACWASNRGVSACAIGRGVHGLSNARLDTPWPKLVHTKEGVAAWIEHNNDDVEPLFALLADRTLAPDDELPSTGVSRGWERVLSAPFIVGEHYGTRCSTVLTISRDNHARLIERSFNARGEVRGEVEQTFDATPIAYA